MLAANWVRVSGAYLDRLSTNLFPGHISRDCTAPNGGPLNTAGKTCYRCGETGHISRDCTQTEVNGDTAAPSAASVAPAAPTTAVA